MTIHLLSAKLVCDLYIYIYISLLFKVFILFYMIDLPFYNLNDSEFQLALSEFTNNFHYDLDLLND